MYDEKETKQLSFGIKSVKSSRPYFADDNNSVSNVDDDFNDDDFNDDDFDDDGFGKEAFRMHMALAHVFEWDFHPLESFNNASIISGIIIGKKPIYNFDDEEVGIIFLVYNKNYAVPGVPRDATTSIPCFYSQFDNKILESLEIGDFVSFVGYLSELLDSDDFDYDFNDESMCPMDIVWEDIEIIEKHFFQNHSIPYDD